jgi:hypothetical protein
MRERLTQTGPPKTNGARPEIRKLMDSAVVLDLTFHRPGIRRKADISLVETDADKNMLGLTKAIVDSKEYAAVIKVASETRRWVGLRALPSPLKRGTYLISVELVADVYEYLDAADASYMAKAEEFLLVYPWQVREAKQKLLDQFDPDNYPSVKKLRAAFYVERRLIDFGVPNPEKIGKAFWLREKKRAEKTWAKAADEVQAALRTAFRELVGHLAERLQPKDDGTKKVFRDTAVDKVLEFVDLFQQRNLTGDAELSGLVTQARNVLKGKKADKLRTSVVARGEVAEEMGRVMTALDELMETAPRRRIRFDD